MGCWNEGRYLRNPFVVASGDQQWSSPHRLPVSMRHVCVITPFGKLYLIIMSSLEMFSCETDRLCLRQKDFPTGGYGAIIIWDFIRTCPARDNLNESLLSALASDGDEFRKRIVDSVCQATETRSKIRKKLWKLISSVCSGRGIVKAVKKSSISLKFHQSCQSPRPWTIASNVKESLSTFRPTENHRKKKLITEIMAG